MKQAPLKYALPLLIVLVTIAGLPIPVMDVDAAQLAHMADWMATHNDPWNLTCLGKPYLDKPHLLFWLSALCFKLFGTSSWAYKLPSLLFAFGGLAGIYGLGKLLYDEATGKLAALLLGSCTMFFLFVNDCRADTLLTSSIILAVYFYQKWWLQTRWYDAVLAGIFAALAVSAKGPMGIMLPLLAFGIKALWNLDFKPLRHPHTLLFLLVLGLGIIPVVYAHWVQHGTTGLKFFFWTQSFGRITGESEWKNDPAPWFFFHTIPWIVLPYTFWTLAAVYFQLRDALKAWKTKQRSSFEILALAAIVPVFVVLSFSKYKLPHYIYPIIPFLLLITAHSWSQWGQQQQYRWLNKIQVLLTLLLLWLSWGISISLHLPDTRLVTWFLFGLASLYTLPYLWNAWRKGTQLIPATALGMTVIFMGLNRIAYPALLEYQSGTHMGTFIREQHISVDSVYTFVAGGPYSLHFESRGVIRHINALDELKNLSGYVLTDPNGKALLGGAGLDTLTIYTRPDYAVTHLRPAFFFPEKRQSMLKQRLLVKISPAQR